MGTTSTKIQNHDHRAHALLSASGASRWLACTPSARLEEQFGDKKVVPFSFSTAPASVQKEQASCWLTYTNETTHDIIRANLDRSPLYSGMI